MLQRLRFLEAEAENQTRLHIRLFVVVRDLEEPGQCG
jgi:hypothetical protein